MPIEQTHTDTENNREINKEGKRNEREGEKDERKLSEKSWHKRLYRLSGKLFTRLDECLLTTKIRASSFLFRLSFFVFLSSWFPSFLFYRCLLACTKSQTSAPKKEREREREERWHYNTCLKLSKKEGRGNAWMVNKWTLIDFFFLGWVDTPVCNFLSKTLL